MGVDSSVVKHIWANGMCSVAGGLLSVVFLGYWLS